MSATNADTFKNEIVNILEEISPIYNLFCMPKMHQAIQRTFNECKTAVDENSDYCINYFKIETVVDYLRDELHTGHWRDIPEDLRQAYTAASVLKVAIILKSLSDIEEDKLKSAIKVLDMAILLGAPIADSSELLPALASRLSQMLLQLKITNNVNVQNKKTGIKRTIEDFADYNSLQAIEVDYKSDLSVNEFIDSFFSKKKPVCLQDNMSNWPASTKWLDVSYLLNLAQYRTVPIEIGSQYSDENWSQKLMLFGDFIKNFYLSDTNVKGYLAQHNLFDQIPELFNDILYPKYCFTNKDTCKEPDINAWFGPKGTVSSLHFDPRDNILAQIFGTKQILLFSPEDSEYLYPHDTLLLSNTAQVDPVKPDLQIYPNFSKAKIFKCLLHAGEMLYIPKKWWHHVTSLEKSFSVNFWWD